MPSLNLLAIAPIRQASAFVMLHPFLESIDQLLLGTERRMRRNLGRFLLSALVYAFSLLAQLQASTWIKFVPLRWKLLYMAVVGCAVLGFYGLMRSGFSRRFADPAMTASQMSFAILALAGAYLINPQVRGMLLMIAALVLIYGAFTLSPRNCRRLGWFSVLSLGASMGVGAFLAPDFFPPREEGLHLVFSVVVLPTIAILAGQLSRLRSTLHAQKGELKAALERIRLLATRDELTGLPNRRHAQDLLDREGNRAHAERAPLSVCMIDLDHFKRVNDTMGHAAGDQVLRLFAQHSQAALRDTDVLTRWGGEEFLLLLPDTQLADAEQVVERLRMHMSSQDVWRERPELRVTFSGGITAHLGGENIQETISRADARLYAAKAQGRNRVLVSA